MFKKLVVGLLVVGLVLGLSSIVVAERIKVSVYEGMVDTAYIKLLKDTFEKSNPDIELSFERTPPGGYDKILLDAAVGNLLDITGCAIGGMLDFLIQNNIIIPLDDLLAELGINVAEFPKVVLDMVTKEGKLYLIPGWVGAQGFVNYNKRIFDETGLAYPTDNSTWEEIKEMARKLTVRDDKGNVTRYGVFCKWPQAYMFPAFGGYVVDDPFFPTQALFGHDGYVRGMTEYRNLVEEGTMMSRQTFVALGGSKPKIWCEEKIAMMITGPGNAGFELGGFDWDIVPMPLSSEDGHYSINCSGSTITVGSENPLAALKWVVWRNMGRESLQIYNLIECRINGNVPWYPELYNLYREIAIGRTPANWESHNTALAKGKVTMAFANSLDFGLIYDEVFVAVMEGRQPISALVEAEKEAQKAIDKLPWNQK